MSDRLDEESYDGAWATGAQAVNALIDDLAAPTAEIARVIEAVAEGDLSQHMALEIEGRPLRGEFRRIGRTVNTMVDQLSSFADEVTRVAREVGTDGRLGGQADVRGVAGTWRALTDSVNTMASNLTNQVRSISDGGHRDRAGRPVPQDHRERPGRGRRAGRHDQLADRHAAAVRRRGHPGGPRGRHRGPARRPGRRCRTWPAPGRTSPTR